jgi:hypothetical protein
MHPLAMYVAHYQNDLRTEAEASRLARNARPQANGLMASVRGVARSLRGQRSSRTGSWSHA